MISSEDSKCSSRAMIQNITLNKTKKIMNTNFASIFNQMGRSMVAILFFSFSLLYIELTLITLVLGTLCFVSIRVPPDISAGKS